MRVIEVGPDAERTGAAINRAVGEALQSCSLRQVCWALMTPAGWRGMLRCMRKQQSTGCRLHRPSTRPHLDGPSGICLQCSKMALSTSVPGLQCCMSGQEASKQSLLQECCRTRSAPSALTACCGWLATAQRACRHVGSAPGAGGDTGDGAAPGPC